MDFNSAMRRVFATLSPGVFSICFGFMAHIIFYPLVQSWGNRRIRNLGRPAVGVVVNIVPFLFLRSVLRQSHRCNGEQEEMQDDLIAFMLSFGWNALGVLFGYFFDDFRKGRGGEF